MDGFLINCLVEEVGIKKAVAKYPTAREASQPLRACPYTTGKKGDRAIGIKNRNDCGFSIDHQLPVLVFGLTKPASNNETARLVGNA